MTYFNIKVETTEDGKYKGNIPGMNYKVVSTSFYELQARLYEFLDNDGWENFRLLFLLNKPLEHNEY